MYIAAPISLLHTTSAPARAGVTAGLPGRQKTPPAAGRLCRAQRGRRSSANESSTASGSAAERIIRALLPGSAAYSSQVPNRPGQRDPALYLHKQHAAQRDGQGARAAPFAHDDGTNRKHKQFKTETRSKSRSQTCCGQNCCRAQAALRRRCTARQRQGRP